MKKVVAVINNGTANIKNAARILFRDKLLQFWIPPMGRVEPHWALPSITIRCSTVHPWKPAILWQPCSNVMLLRQRQSYTLSNWGPLPKLRQEYLQTQLKRSHKSTKGILYISLGRTKITCIPCIGRKSLLYYKERGKFKKPTLILVCINFCSNVFYRMYIKSTINYS